MNAQPFVMRTVCSTAIGFVGTMFLVAAFAIALGLGVIEAPVAQRAMDCALGLMVLLIGNALPKLKPLQRLRMGRPAARIELFSGWVLIVAGAIWVAAFMAWPMVQARFVAAWTAILAAALIGGAWTVVAIKARAAISSPAAEALDSRKSNGLIVWLFAAFLYVLVVACTKFLVGADRAYEIFLWETLGFWLVYSILYAVLERRERAICET